MPVNVVAAILTLLAASGSALQICMLGGMCDEARPCRQWRRPFPISERSGTYCGIQPGSKACCTDDIIDAVAAGLAESTVWFGE